ncbi:hypothetical protein B0J14DRAFT_669932 [Halenospora varia]|nr:hypothetical protein B0J14DRAFT_669932 [Halenospora varia]
MTSRSKISITPAMLGNEVVAVIVGPHKKEFIAHMKILCDASAFFSKGFEGNFREAAERRMEMLEHPPIAFVSCLTWLYSGCVLVTRDNQRKCSWDYPNERVCYLYDAYIFGEKICAEEFLNDVMDEIQDWQNMGGNIPYMSSIKCINENTNESSMLHKYCAYTFISRNFKKPFDSTKVEFQNFLKATPDMAPELLAIVLSSPQQKDDPETGWRTVDLIRGGIVAVRTVTILLYSLSLIDYLSLRIHALKVLYF